MHLVLAHDILPNNTSDIRSILAPSVQQLGRGRGRPPPSQAERTISVQSIRSSDEPTKIPSGRHGRPSGPDYAEH